MTQDLPDLKRRLTLMMVMSAVTAFVAVGFAVADFVFGVKWAMWGFVAFLVAGFAVQLWFVRGFARMKKGG